MRDKALAVLSLFASTGALLCCALPAALVALGLGATVVGAVAAAPWLLPLSRNKEWVFLGAGLLLAVNWFSRWRWRGAAAACAARDDGVPTQTACDVVGRFTRVALWVSTGLYAIGFVAAYVAFPVARALGWL